eukprot:COSAG04_NODE_30349_length_263_cov_0.634146_1_plen_46_part_01
MLAVVYNDLLEPMGAKTKVTHEQLGGVATASGKNRALRTCRRSCSL